MNKSFPSGTKLAVTCFIAGWLSLAAIPIVITHQAHFYAQKEPRYLSPLPFPQLIIRNDSYGKGYFGASRNGGRFHEGVDFIAAIGTPVLASKSGRVIVSAQGKSYGKYIELLHSDGLMTCYAHLSSQEVKQGDWVEQKSLLGRSGNTGNANHPRIKPHLHFEIRDRNKSLNPFINNRLDKSIPVS